VEIDSKLIRVIAGRLYQPLRGDGSHGEWKRTPERTPVTLTDRIPVGLSDASPGFFFYRSYSSCFESVHVALPVFLFVK
jgi:UDP-galactopyranose mutase